MTHQLVHQEVQFIQINGLNVCEQALNIISCAPWKATSLSIRIPMPRTLSSWLRRQDCPSECFRYASTIIILFVEHQELCGKNHCQVWFQNARAKWRRNMMRQEGNNVGNNLGCPGTPVSSSTGNSPSVGPSSAFLGDSNSQPSTSMEEIHALHHLHSAVTSQVNFSDLYWRRLEAEEDNFSAHSGHFGC